MMAITNVHSHVIFTNRSDMRGDTSRKSSERDRVSLIRPVILTQSIGIFTLKIQGTKERMATRWRRQSVNLSFSATCAVGSPPLVDFAFSRLWQINEP